MPASVVAILVEVVINRFRQMLPGRRQIYCFRFHVVSEPRKSNAVSEVVFQLPRLIQSTGAGHKHRRQKGSTQVSNVGKIVLGVIYSSRVRSCSVFLHGFMFSTRAFLCFVGTTQFLCASTLGALGIDLLTQSHQMCLAQPPEGGEQWSSRRKLRIEGDLMAGRVV